MYIRSLLHIGLIFYFFGIMFLLDRSLLAIGNISFIMGLVTLIGPQNTFGFFAKQGKIKGSAFFFGGFILICIGKFLFTLFGFCAQVWGILLLFRDFFRTIFNFLQTLPVIGPFLRNSSTAHSIVDTLAGNKEKGKAGKASSKPQKFEV